MPSSTNRSLLKEKGCIGIAMFLLFSGIGSLLIAAAQGERLMAATGWFCAASGVVFLFLGARAFLQVRKMPPETKPEYQPAKGNVEQQVAEDLQHPVIEAEGDSLEQARIAVKEKIPEDMEILAEMVISNGQPVTIQAGGQTEEEAYKKAEGQIPNGAQVRSRKTLVIADSRHAKVTAFNESEGRIEADIQIEAGFEIQSFKLTDPGRKGFLGIGTKAGQYEVMAVRDAVVEIVYQCKPRIRVKVRKKKEEVLDFVAALTGGWPDELNRSSFEQVDFDKLLVRLKSYQEMPHPGSMAYYPDYRMVSGQVARMGDPEEDFKIASTASRLSGRSAVNLFDDKACQLAFEIIQHYGGQRLSKFLFFLPRGNEMVNQGNKVVVMEDWVIDVYKGVENVLFRIYEELGEQVFTDETVFTDEMVKQKLLSIVRNAQQ